VSSIWLKDDALEESAKPAHAGNHRRRHHDEFGSGVGTVCDDWRELETARQPTRKEGWLRVAPVGWLDVERCGQTGQPGARLKKRSASARLMSRRKCFGLSRTDAVGTEFS
jgi:hypothetical protein